MVENYLISDCDRKYSHVKICHIFFLRNSYTCVTICSRAEQAAFNLFQNRLGRRKCVLCSRIRHMQSITVQNNFVQLIRPSVRIRISFDLVYSFLGVVFVFGDTKNCLFRMKIMTRLVSKLAPVSIYRVYVYL